MTDNHSTFIQRLNNRNGQVALFIALIFQVLFLFFAMVINVGLLVHHKINLQNSVDLAAYYGAMKQAENMNAISHVNYQIRQSWKLLSWRYRMVGSAGEWYVHPYDKTTKQLRGGDGEDTGSGADQGFYDAPSFCGTYVPFKPMPPAENTCRGMASMSGIQLFKAAPLIAGFQTFSKQFNQITEVLRNNAIRQCKKFGTYNYILLGTFVVSFNVDQGDRSLLMTTIARNMSTSTNDFVDLDGQSVKLGIQKTFENNLTEANRDSEPDMEIYNSLGDPNCGVSGVANNQPPKWLAPVKIYPGFNYIDTVCDGTKIEPKGKALPENAQDQTQFPEYWNAPENSSISQFVTELANFIGLRLPLNDPYNFSVGVEKNPWCMAYVGVKATSRPKIPFSPFGQVELKARSFAKPFGGRMGPWYQSGWSRGSERSNTGPKVDPLLPPRNLMDGNLGNPQDPTRAANFSRFVGDKYGLKTRNNLYQYGKAIYELDSQWKSPGYVNIVDGKEENFGDEAPNFEHWTRHLPFKWIEQGGSGDILAWDHKNNVPSRMRDLEMAAILPDLFDITYYSIEPDFYGVYYKRMKNGILKAANFDKEFRPDIGYHRGYNQDGANLNEFSIKDQYAVLKKPFLNLDMNKLSFITKQWDHVLTGWADKSLSDYSLDTTRLGKCQYPLVDGDPLETPTSGNCVVGGTTGFAVKTISSDSLMREMPLGGPNNTGTILNPPPADF